MATTIRIKKSENAAASTKGGDVLFSDLFGGTQEAAALAQGEIAVYRRRLNPVRYDFFTPGIEAITGYAPGMFTPELWDSLVERVKFIGELDGLSVDEARRRYHAGEVNKWHAECLIRHRNGELRWILDLGVPLRDGGGAVIGSFGFLQDITEQKTSGFSHTQRIDPRFRTLTQLLPAIVWTTDARLRFTSSEGAGLQFLKLRPGQVVGQSLAEFLRADDEKHPTLVAHRNALLGQAVDHELELGGRHYLAHLEPIRNELGIVTGVLGLASDITTTRDAENRLLALESYERALLQAIPDVIAVFDEKGMVLDYKPTASLEKRFPPSMVIGRNLRDLGIGDADREALLAAAMRAIDTTEVQLLEYKIDVDGEVTVWDARVAPLDSVRVILVSRDVSERKRADEQRRRIEVQMRDAQQLESLGVLAGGIAHDFNNLLLGIIGNAEIAMHDLADGHPAADAISELRRAATRAAELTHLMLAYAGRGKFQTSVLDLNVVACEVAQLVQAAISKKVVLHFELARDLPVIRADTAQLRQVIMNLIVNGAEAIGDAEGEIYIRTSVVEVDEAGAAMALPAGEISAGSYVALEVRDNGCGMDDARQRRIFEPFFTTKFTGRGLGLAAVLGILRSHHGGIRVQSEPDLGSKFTVYLPAAVVSVSEEPVAATPREPAPKLPPEQKHILVVDDENVVRRVIKRQLERAGHLVLLAQDGREAVQIVEEQPDLIDVMLLDLTMPAMGGEDVLRHLRGKGFKLPIVLMSGYDESEAAAARHKNDIHSFLRKPFTGESLLGSINAALESAAAGKAPP